MLARPVTRRWERYFPDNDPGGVFSIVADVERYPEFVPGCMAARIVERGAKQWTVENVFGFGPARTRFCSIAELAPPSALTISSFDGPWREFRVHWRFQPEGSGCRLACHAHLDFKSALIASMAAMTAGEIERWVVDAFDTRIRKGIKGST
ncbi:MAG: type II toxin-antitoxin system RatA family toxin [Rhodomicrobium sp.]